MQFGILFITTTHHYLFSTTRILLIQFECSNWKQGRSYHFGVNFAFKESLEKLGVEVVMLTTPWLPYLERICEGKTFDQLWLNDLSHFADFNLDLSIVKDIAPIRLGFITESLEYNEEEYKTFPWLKERRKGIDKQLEHCTHIVAVDEEDVTNLTKSSKLPTMCFPYSIPEDLILSGGNSPKYDLAFFSGSVYGEREEWLKNEKLHGLLEQNKLSSDTFIYPFLFDLLPRHQKSLLKLLPITPYILFTLHTLKSSERFDIHLMSHGKRKCYKVVLQLLISFI